MDQFLLCLIANLREINPSMNHWLNFLFEVSSNLIRFDFEKTP